MKLLTVKDVASILQIGAYEVRKKRFEWRDKYGVNFINLNGNPRGKIRFDPNQINAMVKQWGQN